NRVWVAPMCQYSAEDRDGVPTEWHLVHYGSRAAGGAGLVIVEATAVSPEGRISPWDTGIWNDEQTDGWAYILDFMHGHGAAVGIQLAHAGRKASIYREWSGHGTVPISDGGWQTISSTDEAFTGYDAPRKLETAEVSDVVKDFVTAARRAQDAGFDVIEIHAAHGYLIHQFLSPLTNQRTDIYGGELENRARLLLEIVEGIRREVGEGMPILVRFSATDYVDGGWDETQTATVAKWCAEAGADLFDISTGGLVTGVKIPSGPGYQVPIAEFVAERVDEPVAVVGQITTGAQAEEILQRGNVDVIMIGRAELRDPMWPLRAAHELGAEVDYWPKQYSRGKF
ncbi:MAG: NADH:flavin oxidoreductase/NADH oxidase, partial [Rhodoluna sp.]|nr:NADH:flavin oxidoreductase/NADH oxidase [Rhodoluna sp.]